MDSLYVCLFSNGHIKVGRSSDAPTRVAQHADRVACIGVTITRWKQFVCDQVTQREALLIQRCAAIATQRMQSEWFAGLDYAEVCEWAEECVTQPVEELPALGNGFGIRLRHARRAMGLNQTEIGVWVNVTKMAVSHWEKGRNEPGIAQLRTLCERLGVSADYLIFGKSAQSGVERADPVSSPLAQREPFPVAPVGAFSS